MSQSNTPAAQTGRETWQQSSKQNHEWIVGRIKTLLSHYPGPSVAPEVEREAMKDWLRMLAGFSQQDIEHGCAAWLRHQPRRRPTPGDIRAMAAEHGKAKKPEGRGDRSTLSRDELEILETRTIPLAREWLKIPGLAEHGRAFLDYWGEI